VDKCEPEPYFSIKKNRRGRVVEISVWRNWNYPWPHYPLGTQSPYQKFQFLTNKKGDGISATPELTPRELLELVLVVPVPIQPSLIHYHSTISTIEPLVSRVECEADKGQDYEDCPRRINHLPSIEIADDADRERNAKCNESHVVSFLRHNCQNVLSTVYHG
jgi:hypothetical protein